MERSQAEVDQTKEKSLELLISQQSETIRELREALLGLITKHPNGRWYDHPVPLAGTVERAGKLLDALANSVTEAE